MRVIRKYPKMYSGFSLIELMLALTIGMFLIGGVFTVYTNGRVTQDLTEAQTRLVDDARFAVETIGYDLRAAGFWGGATYSMIRGHTGPNSTLQKTVNPPISVIPGDCAPLWHADLSMPISASDNVNPFVDTCVPNGDYRANTDVLTVKYANSTPVETASLAPNITYLYSNLFGGELFIGNNVPTFLPVTSPVFNRMLKSRVYFVNEFTEQNGDGYPSLHRVDLVAGPSMANVMLLPGVEDMQIQFGVDTTRDGSVNMYVDPADPVLSPSLEKVKAVQVWVRLRSREVELLPTETQSMSMAGRPPVVFSDGYRRVVMSTIVKLRNKQHFDTAAGG